LVVEEEDDRVKNIKKSVLQVVLAICRSCVVKALRESGRDVLKKECYAEIR
jgi:hypothetical protein